MPFTDESLACYFGTHGQVDNDSDQIGGDIDTGNTRSDGAEDEGLYRPTIGNSDKVLRHIEYRKNEWSGTLQGMRFFLRTGGKLPGSSGVVGVRSTSGSDVGKVWFAYRHAGDWIPVGEEVTLAGASMVTGLVSWDEGTDWAAVYEPGIPTGDLYISINGEIIGVIFGGADGNFCASSLYQLALADSLNSSIEAENRLSDPSDGVGSWSRAVRWPGTDESLTIPGNDLYAGDHIGYAVKMLVPMGFTKPFGAVLDCDVCPIFDPVE